MKPYYEHAGITIYHGDCREVLPSLEADLVLADPPYGIALENHAAGKERRVGSFSISGDDSKYLSAWIADYCFVREWPLVCFGSPKAEFAKCKQTLIWDKGPAVGGGGDPMRYWKFTYELVHISGTDILNGQRDSAVLKYWLGPQDSQLHPAQKPCDLLEYLINKTTRPGMTVVDPFCGSGSTLVAAKNSACKAIGIEIEEKYCEIAAKRLSQEVLQF